MKYPHLVMALKELTDHGMLLWPEAEMKWPPDARYIEAAASRLPEALFWEVACLNGDVYDDQVACNPDARSLWDFLAEAFDGDTHEDFFKPYDPVEMNREREDDENEDT